MKTTSTTKTIATVVLTSIACSASITFSDNTSYTAYESKVNECSQYKNWSASGFLINNFELLRKFPGMIFYSEKYYAGDPRTKSDDIMDIHFYLVREVCDDPSSIDGVSIRAMPLESRNVLGETPHNDEGCYFPHLYAGSRRANEVEGEMRHLLEYRVCERENDCELKISMIPFEQDKKLPVEEGCSFILYEPIYSNAWLD